MTGTPSIVATILLTLLGGTGAVAATGLIQRRTNNATAESVSVETSSKVVVMLRAQMDMMQTRIDRLEERLANETAQRIAASHVRDIHVAKLELAITAMGGTIPARPY